VVQIPMHSSFLAAPAVGITQALNRGTGRIRDNLDDIEIPCRLKNLVRDNKSAADGLVSRIWSFSACSDLTSEASEMHHDLQRIQAWTCSRTSWDIIFTLK
jgi:hypothetical protein